MNTATLFSLRRAARTSAGLDDGGASGVRAVLDGVADFHKVNGYAPALSDLARAVGWTKERTRDAVRALTESGHLVQKPGVTRSLRVASEPERLAARAAAWYSALRDLPALEVAAARAALARLEGANGGAP